MKVGLLTNIPSPYRIPLWQKLAKEFDITVLYTSVNDSFKREWEINFGSGYNYISFADVSKNEDSEYKINLKLYRHIINTKYDVLIIGAYGNINHVVCCLFQKILRRKNVMLWDGGFNNKKEPWLKNKIKSFFYKYLTDAICVSGINAKNVLMRYENNDQKYFNVHLTCDTEYFTKSYLALKKEKESVKEKYKLKQYEKIVFCAARLDKIKGIQDLLRAFKKVNNDKVCLLIAGTGPDKKELEDIISHEKIRNVFFTGFVDIFKLPELYTISDLFVLPSYYDPWALVINEAMACGLPVISTTMAGASYDLIREGENGFVVEPGDIEAIFDKMNLIILNDEIRVNYSNNSLKIISGWTLDHSVVGFKKCINYLSS